MSEFREVDSVVALDNLGTGKEWVPSDETK